MELREKSGLVKMDYSNKRIAIFLHGLYGGGAERTMLNLADGLARRGFIVDLVLSRAAGPYLKDIPRQVRLVDLDAQRVRYCLIKLIEYMRREKPDAMLSALDYTNIIGLLARSFAGKPKKFFIVEQNTFSVRLHQMSRLNQIIFLLLVKIFYPRAEKIITVSNGVAADLAKVTGIKSTRIQTIHNPVVTPQLTTLVTEPINDPWIENNHKPLLLAVGRLTTQKDFFTLIESFSLVHQKRPVRLAILGEGEDRFELEKLAKSLGVEDDVYMPGFVKNPYAYMKKASLFILSSKWEGLPTVLIEALYCGLPIISTNCPNGPHEILKGGEYGRLVPVKNAPALVQAIENALDSPPPPLPDESWKPYTLENVVNDYQELFLGN